MQQRSVVYGNLVVNKTLKGSQPQIGLETCTCRKIPYLLIQYLYLLSHKATYPGFQSNRQVYKFHINQVVIFASYDKC